MRSLGLSARLVGLEYRPGPGGNAFLLAITRGWQQAKNRLSLLHLEGKSNRVLAPFLDGLPCSSVVSGMHRVGMKGLDFMDSCD